MPEYIRHDEGTFSSLTKQQKEAVGLLSIGTFLEYFDLMLYVHMIVLLNELFFPKADPRTQAIYSAIAFCSIYVLRPFGALIFGWIGDNIGRKTTVVITTFMMAVSCIIMANLPTYVSIGITATYLVTVCRIIQGLASMGEIIGAELYLTEMAKPPIQYLIVSLMPIFAVLGGTVALGIASLCSIQGIHWRIAFWIGAVVAMVGTIARTALRETPEFVNAKQRAIIVHNQNLDTLSNTSKEKIQITHSPNITTLIYYFLVSCVWPVCFYFVYIYLGNFLKTRFNYTAEQVIHQNFIVSMINLLGYAILAYLCYIKHPLKILKIKLFIIFPVILICPYMLKHISTPIYVFFIQVFFILLLNLQPALSVFYSHIPVLKRFTYASFIYALSRAVMHIVTSFGIIYCIEYFGEWGLLIVMLPIIIGFALGVSYFQKLETNKM